MTASDGTSVMGSSPTSGDASAWPTGLDRRWISVVTAGPAIDQSGCRDGKVVPSSGDRALELAPKVPGLTSEGEVVVRVLAVRHVRMTSLA